MPFLLSSSSIRFRVIAFLLLFLPTVGFAERIEEEQTILTPKKSEESPSAIVGLKRLNSIKKLCYSDIDSALIKIRTWTNNNDFDTSTFALKVINQYYDKQPFDSIHSMKINRENAILLLNIGDLQGAGLYMSKAIASAILAEDSIQTAKCFITIAELNIRNFDFPRAKENLVYATSYYPLIQISAEYQLLDAILEAQNGRPHLALKQLYRINPNDFNNPRMCGLYGLYGRYLAIETHNLKADTSFNQYLVDAQSKFTLVIANSKNSYLNSMLTTKSFNSYLAQRAILGSSPQIKDYTIVKATNGEFMYLTSNYWSTKKKQEKYAVALVLFLLLVIAISIYLQIRSKKNPKRNFIGFFNKELKSIYALTNSPQNFNQIKLRIKEMIHRLNNMSESADRSSLVTDKLMTKLKEYEGVNQNDLKLIALILMRFDIPEMSQSLNITPDAVRKRKNRLKSKLSIEQDLQLYAFLRDHS